MDTGERKAGQKTNLLLFLALVALAGSALANDDFGTEKGPATKEQRQKGEEYWTPERMEKAVPLPLEAKPKTDTPKCPPETPSDPSPKESNRE